MNSFITLRKNAIVILTIVLLLPVYSWSQKRLKPPKRDSKVESVDLFVNKSFNLYHKVFVYDSLSKAGVEVPADIEDELVERAEQDIDSLWSVAPDIIDDISDASFMKQTKATLNMNKAKKALKFCALTLKAYFSGNEDDEE